MSRWFRHYAGMMRDEKLVRVALKSKQPIANVLWIWGAILESAAEIDDAGQFEVDAAEVAYFLRADEADIASIFGALETMGRTHGGSVVKWGDRQFQSDRSAERQRRLREKQQTASDGDPDTRETVTIQPTDGGVTAQSRHGDAPETETETDTQTEKKEDSEDKSSALDDETDLFRRGREILGSSGGSLTAKLLKAKGGKIPLARAALEMASTKNNAREWVGAHLSQSDDKRPWPKGFKPRPGDKKDWPEDFHPPPGAKVRRLQFDDGTVNWDFEQHAM